MTGPRVAVLRNEVDDAHEYHCDALAACFPGAVEIDYARGDRLDPTGNDGATSRAQGAIDGVVLTGSTAGVYEADEYEWMRDQRRLVTEFLEAEIPTLGVCFGHQLVNAALGGRVEAKETTAGLVEVEFVDDPLFEGVSPVVPAVHGDHVVEPGEGLERIASTDHSEYFATRHPDAPLWTTQFHPEFTAAHRPRIERAYGWDDGEYTFRDVNATRVYENFLREVERNADGR